MIKTLEDYSMAIYHLDALSRYNKIVEPHFLEDNSIFFIRNCMNELVNSNQEYLLDLKKE